MRFTKKPETVEAVQFVGEADGKPTFSTPTPDWLLEAFQRPANAFGHIAFKPEGVSTSYDPLAQRAYLMVNAFDSTRGAVVNDWIIRCETGEVLPVQADVFDASYVPESPMFIITPEMLEGVELKLGSPIRVPAAIGLGGCHNADLADRLKVWSSEMRRSADAMIEAGELFIAANNEKLSEDLALAAKLLDPANG
tara:strand:+ start:449 stop:1033 length:585 start_codon:yes stop_codon:yes gene_type:complete